MGALETVRGDLGSVDLVVLDSEFFFLLFPALRVVSIFSLILCSQ